MATGFQLIVWVEASGLLPQLPPFPDKGAVFSLSTYLASRKDSISSHNGPSASPDQGFLTGGSFRFPISRRMAAAMLSSVLQGGSGSLSSMDASAVFRSVGSEQEEPGHR